jgi:8-oxo-dGTP pyrophosphatase MutT (NUDIX family)
VTTVRRRSERSRADERTCHGHAIIIIVTVPSERRFAGVLAYHNGSVVLVREQHQRWGGVFWNLPSGMVEAHETPAEGAARELAEETGLQVAPSDLCLRSTSSTVVNGATLQAWNFDVDVERPEIVVSDPDLLVQEARWFPVAAAIELLRSLPYRPLAEPAVAILTGTAADGAHWQFSSPEADPVVTRLSSPRF